jgi:hypothetical protein
MVTSAFSGYMPPIGGAKQPLPELTDHCRPRGGKTYSEHDYPGSGQAGCRRCGADEEGAP